MGRKAEPMEWTPDCGLPGPEEIRAACELIQATWTPIERRRRIVEQVEALEVSVVRVADLLNA